VRRAEGNPDFPGAIWFDTPMANKWTAGRPDGNASVDGIVIHDTEGGWVASVATLQNDPAKSVHYIVDADGSRVGQFRPETDTTWHAGNWAVNTHSIGIEHVGTASNPNGYSDGEYQQSVALVKSIRSRWKVPLDRAHIFGHYQVPDGNKISESAGPCTDTLDACETSANYGGASNHRDPGYHWEWCQYMEKLGGGCACNDAYPLWNCTTDKTEAVRCAGGKVEIDHCDQGCQPQPLGSNDVCNKSLPSGGGGSAAAQLSGHPSGASDGSGDKGDDPMASSGHGGCSVGGGASSGGVWVIMLALAMIVTRRRMARTS
jgi:MYXO-CTERM domain-containing protein